VELFEKSPSPIFYYNLRINGMVNTMVTDVWMDLQLEIELENSKFWWLRFTEKTLE